MTSIYVIKSEGGPVKVGFSKSPLNRLKALMDGQPFKADIVYLASPPSGLARAVETTAHLLLAEKRRRGEWFNVSEQDAIAAVIEAIRYVSEHGRAPLRRARRKGPGRPAVNAVPVTVRIPPDLCTRLDAWIRRQKPRPTRPEAIRKILDAEL